MQISYLCAKHNDWVYGHPQEALHFLARDEWQGTTLFCDGQFRECIANDFKRCAYAHRSEGSEKSGGRS